MKSFRAFRYNSTVTPFWVLIEQGHTHCVTAASVCQGSGLLRRSWRVPRSKAFALCTKALGNRHLFRNAKTFEDAAMVRNTLRNNASYQFNTAIVSVPTLYAILRAEKREPDLLVAFERFVHAAENACAATDKAEASACRKGLFQGSSILQKEAGKVGGLYKHLPTSHPTLLAATEFLREACRTNANQALSTAVAPWPSIDRATPRKRLSACKASFLRFVDFSVHVGAFHAVPNDLDAPVGEAVELFLDALKANNKDVSVLPVARGVAIAFHLLALAELSPPANAVVARRLYKATCSSANQTRTTQKEVVWNLDLLRSLGDVLEAVVSFLQAHCCGTVRGVQEALATVGSKRQRRRIVSQALLLAKMRVFFFVWRLGEHTGSRPSCLIELQVYEEAEWRQRRDSNVQEVAMVRFAAPFGFTFMFTTSQKKRSAAAPIEYRSLWTHDRDTGADGPLASMHEAFVGAFEAYHVLQTDLFAGTPIDRRYDGVDGELVDTKALLHRQRSIEFTRDGDCTRNPPYLAANFRSKNKSPTNSALGDGPAFSSLFTDTCTKVFRSLLAENGLRHAFGISFPRTIHARDLPIGATSQVMLQRVAGQQQKKASRVGLYDLRRANDSYYFAAVGAAEKIAERTGNQTLLEYAKSNLQFHLRLTDHSEAVANQYYNQAGVGDQLVDVGDGLAAALEACAPIDRLFEGNRAIDPAVRFSHRTQGLRAIRRWIDEGKVASPIGRCERLKIWLQWLLTWPTSLARMR
jgi:hypothetical protein